LCRHLPLSKFQCFELVEPDRPQKVRKNRKFKRTFSPEGPLAMLLNTH